MSLDARLGWPQLQERAPSRTTVLIVDDNEDVRRTLAKLVSRLGYTVKSVGSSEEADQWLGTERFDVLLLDIELPRMSGVEFLTWALKRDPEMAVIMLTGIDDPYIAVECLEHGARTYLVKPVDAEFLRLALRDAVAMRQLLVERNDLHRQR